MSDLENVRNDTSMSVDEVMKKLAADSIEIKYGDLEVRVQGAFVRKMAEQVGRKSPEARSTIRASVTECLDKTVPKILSGKFTKQEADACMEDMVILHALNAFRS